MRYYFINEGTPSEIRAALSHHGLCVPLPALDTLPYPVCRHPDMLIAELNGTLFLHREYHAGSTLLSSLGVPFRISEKPLGARYPEDVALNCFCIGDALFASPRAVSPDVLSWHRQRGGRLLPVKQGYAKCSSVVARGALASADQGIVRAAEEAGIPALLLPVHPIGIEVYDTGFLGGACGLMDDTTLGFFGRIETHPAYGRLSAFFSRFGVSLVSLSDQPLFDLGGMIRVEI